MDNSLIYSYPQLLKDHCSNWLFFDQLQEYGALTMCALDTKDLILKLGNWCWIMSEHWSILTLNYSPKKDHCSNTVKDLFNSIEIKCFWVDCSILLEFSQFLEMLHSVLERIWIKGSLYLSQWVPQGERRPPKKSKSWWIEILHGGSH